MFTASKILELVDSGDFRAIRDLCLTQIRIETAEKAGEFTPAKRKKALLNCLSKDTTRKSLCYAWQEGEKQVVCNGYLAVSLNHPAPFLPVLPDDVPKGNLNVPQMIEDSKRGITEWIKASKIKEDVVGILAENAAKKKQVGAKHFKKIPVEIMTKEGFHIGVDAEFIDNTINALGGYDVCTIGWPQNPRNMIYVGSAMGEAIVCQVRLEKKEETAE